MASRLPPGFPIVGHAIVSADGMIADAAGLMLSPLRNEADFSLFQKALDEAAVVVVGRMGHERHPNPGRRRLVFTGSVASYAEDPGDRLAALYNPAGMELAQALQRMRIAGVFRDKFLVVLDQRCHGIRVHGESLFHPFLAGPYKTQPG